MTRRALPSLYLLILLTLSACASTPLHKAVPEPLIAQAAVKDFPVGIRSWSDEPTKDLASAIERRISQYQVTNAEYYAQHKTYPAMNYLALSGGSNNGAFAAGVLCGWTKSGTRPDFAIVTGVSTGALIAPFAFLGSKYDNVLKQEYTTLKSENIFMGDLWTVLDGVTGGMALADNTPLKKRIDSMITAEMFEDIAEAHRKGRRLFIITTNLEAERGVIWSIGSIANSGVPDGLELFKKILLASAAVPGFFAPVLIDVTVDGKPYQEIHVDGGVTSQVFLFPLKSSRMDRDAFLKANIDRNLYIIRSGKVTPDYQEMQPSTLSLSQRSVESLIKHQGIGDLYRMYSGAQRDGMNFYLNYIPPEFNEKSAEMFDPAYMSKLFDLGYRLNSKGDYWVTEPPGMQYIDK